LLKVFQEETLKSNMVSPMGLKRLLKPTSNN